MNNKSLSKIYNVKYMDYPDFLIHIFKVLSFIFIELMCKRIKFVIIGFFLKAFNGWLFSLCNGPFYIIFLCYIISISFIELYSNIHIQTKFQEGS